jgi:hypothetical protein
MVMHAAMLEGAGSSWHLPIGSTRSTTHSHWHDTQEDLNFRPRPGLLTEPSPGNNTNHNGILPNTSSIGLSFGAPSHPGHGILPTKSSAAISSEAPVKRPFQRDISPSLPSSPPHKKPAPAFHSPDRDLLKEVLQSGGTADLDVQQGQFMMLSLI